MICALEATFRRKFLYFFLLSKIESKSLHHFGSTYENRVSEKYNKNINKKSFLATDNVSGRKMLLR